MGAGAAVAAGAVAAAGIGAVATSSAASSAAGAQTNAANASIAAQQGQFAQTKAGLDPYNQVGQRALNQLNMLTGGMGGSNATPLDPATSPLTAPITMDQATLENTPGYQFNLTQGLKATQNSAAARGLGVSGAALKGAATYATGLADSTYQTQFNDAVTNQTNAYNKLAGLAGLGENAAATTGNLGTQVGSNVGNNLVGAGNANAGASMAVGNNLASGATNASNTASQAYLLNGLLKGNSGGGIFGNQSPSDAGGGYALQNVA